MSAGGLINISEQLKKSTLKTDLSISVHERGASFIQAAKLIIDNARIGDQDQKEQEALHYLIAVQAKWEEKKEQKLNQHDLGALESLLINKINEYVYNGKKNWKKVKDELDNAENHVNWKGRKAVESYAGDGASYVERKEDPIASFTPTQEKEWLKILEAKQEDRPQWFNQLAPWEQNFLQSKVSTWNNKNPKPNLGEFLGPLPTTIRRYPGTPNAYHTQATVVGDNGMFTFDKLRFGVLAPVKLKANSKAKKEQKVDITYQNLEQMLVKAINLKLSKVENGEGTLEFPVLLQTLYSPPFQPPGNYNNEAIQKAVERMRGVLGNENELKQFLSSNGINTKGYDLKVDLLYSNRPVNKGRGLSEIYSKNRALGKENDNAIIMLGAALAKEKKQHEDNKQPIPADLKLALDAFEKYQAIDKDIGKIEAINLLRKNPPYNPVAEKAALEQIIANHVGVRMGSCVSGKDREEMITEIALAQMQFYAKNGAFPPAYDPKDPNNEKRVEFEGMVADLYLKGHGQELAGENSKGCDGLKNVEDVFGKRICDQIRKKAPDYGLPATDKFDPVKDVQKVAGLNKLGPKQLGKITAKDVFKKFVVGVVSLFKNANKIKTKASEIDKEAKDLRKSFLTQYSSHSKQPDPKVEGTKPSPSVEQRDDQKWKPASRPGKP